MKALPVGKCSEEINTDACHAVSIIIVIILIMVDKQIIQ